MITPANSTLCSHALHWDARPRIARADEPQWFPPPSTGMELPAPAPYVQAPASRVQRMPHDRPAPRPWAPHVNKTRRLRLRRHREIVP